MKKINLKNTKAILFFIDHYCGEYLISIAYCPFFIVSETTFVLKKNIRHVMEVQNVFIKLCQCILFFIYSSYVVFNQNENKGYVMLCQDQLLTHVQDNNIISCDQHGFQQNSTCVSQLLECMNDCTQTYYFGESNRCDLSQFLPRPSTPSHTRGYWQNRTFAGYVDIYLHGYHPA